MKRRSLIVLVVLNLAFIWGNSALPGDTSSQVSGGVLAFLCRYFPFLESELAHTLLRKLGHLSEFACLGLLSAQLCRTDLGVIRKTLPLAGMAAGCIDETIQIFTPGRASSLVDVWIDTAGFVLGMALLAALIAARKHITLFWRNKR